MPVYNGERFLREAIESILSQTYTDFEFLVINDGSTDGTEKIIHQYIDQRIVYLKNEKNLGLIASLNLGLEKATGQYIVRMDADDIALPERLAEQLSAFQTHPELVATGSDYYLLDHRKETYYKSNPDSDFIKACLLFAPYFNHPTMMIKNIFSDKGIKYDTGFVHAEDYRLWTELAFAGKFFIVNKPLLKYRSHGSQISSQHRDTQHQISKRIRREYMERLGFQFSEEQFTIHNHIGNNEFIRSEKLLHDIDAWLQNLSRQNKQLKAMDHISFDRAMYKAWKDSCGYSNLGLKAFTMYFKSPLAGIEPLSLKEKLVLFGKCMLRGFRK